MTSAEERVVLVDPAGNVLGDCEKHAAHRNGGQLHLAFSILVFRPDGDVLLQQRASSKYHFAGQWSNTCCGHPRPGEAVAEAASRRLREEFGFTLELALRERFAYDAHDAVSGMTERELLSVFIGVGDPEPRPDPDEIGGWEWVAPEEVARRISERPEEFTPWFRILLQRGVLAR